MKTKPFFIKVLTPLHAGSGSDLGVVDLPIQREAHTSFPKIEASSLKGSIRSDFENRASKKSDEDKIKAMQEIQVIFGFDLNEKDYKTDEKKEEYLKIVKYFRKKKPDGSEDEKGEIQKDFAGALGFSDARILFFPVKSVKGVFAYATCPMVLNRLCEDKKLSNDETINDEFVIPKIDTLSDEHCIVLGDKNNEKYSNKTIVINNKVILEEYSFDVQETKAEEFIKIPNLGIEKERIVIVSDDNFKHFVQNSTEVITRIKINNETGTAQQGGLFTEEYLPAEAIMYALAIGDTGKFINDMPTTLQIGGNSTLGKGIVELTIGVKESDK